MQGKHIPQTKKLAYQCGRVGGESRRRGAAVRVDLENLLDRRRNQQRRRNALLDGEHNALLDLDADRSRAELCDGAVWCSIIVGPYIESERTLKTFANKMEQSVQIRCSAPRARTTTNLRAENKHGSTYGRPCRPLYLDCLDGIFDLKQTALGREGVDAAIVLGPAGAENSRKEERLRKYEHN
jgi:hypothetical protein